MSFEFKESGSAAHICYRGEPIIDMLKNYQPFGGVYSVQNQRMRPGGRAEVAFLPLFATHGYHHAVTDVRYGARLTDDGITVSVTPTDTRSGAEVFKKVREVCTLHVGLEGDRFVWSQRISVTFLEDLELRNAGAKQPVRIYRFPKADGTPGFFLQFADPMPVNASGPAVPMTRDWIRVLEPTVGPDTFRKHWKRDYVKIIYQDTDGGFSWTELNRQKAHAMQADNQCARRCHPKGKLYLIKDDGEALEYSFDSPSHYHHICEWGMDFHCWLDVEDFVKDGLVLAGTSVEAETTLRLAPPEKVAESLGKARHIELTERERFYFDLPAYEEPENTFTTSALDHADAMAWQPTSEGCSWRKEGGYGIRSGCLVIENKFSNIGSWEMPLLGPSLWANPYVPGARYRLSAMVRCENLDTHFGGPTIGVTFKNYLGPAFAKKFEEIDGKWSHSIFGADTGFTRNIGWTALEVLTIPCPSYVLSATIRLKFIGRGRVFFSNVRWELIK